jgi:hypothetical protein
VFDREHCQEVANLAIARVARVTAIAVLDVAAHPAQVGLLGARAQVSKFRACSNAIL